MEVLRGGELVPSGMLVGGVTDSHLRERAGPGSESVLDQPVLDHLPQPTPTDGKIPVVHPGIQKHVDSTGGRPGAGNFQTITIGGVWKEVS